METHSLNFGGVLSETNRIVKAQSGHFFALLIIFVLPLSFAVVVYPSPFQPSSIIPSYNRFLSSLFSLDPEIPPVGKSDLLRYAIFYLFVLIFSLFTSASITYSTFHGFYGKPVKLISSLKSSLFSFFPLLVTYIASQLILGLVILAFGSFTVMVFNGLSLLGVEIDYEREYSFLCASLITVLLFVLLMYLQVEWYLANVVVVVESLWGFAPLKRSSLLVEGMRLIAYTVMTCFGMLIGLWVMLFPSLVPNDDGIGWESLGWLAVVRAILTASFVAVLMLYAIAANTVLFMYCKALHGELVVEMVDEFEPEYISLVMGDDKVPKAVYVV